VEKTKPNYSGMQNKTPPKMIDWSGVGKQPVKYALPTTSLDISERENANVDMWNTKVEQTMEDDWVASQRVLTPEQQSAVDKSVRDQSIKSETALSEASFGESFGSFVDVFSKHNDFTALYNKKEVPEYKKDDDWINTVSDYNNVKSLLESAGLPITKAKDISKTTSYEEFAWLSNKIKDDTAQQEHINNTLGSGMQTTAIIGAALTGLDTAVAIALPFGASASIARTLTKVEGLTSALAAEKILASQRTIAQIANLSTATAIPVIQANIHEDFTETDGAISFLVNAGFNRWQLNKIANSAEHSLADTISAFKAKEVLDNLDKTRLLPSPSKQLLLPAPAVEHTISTNIDGIVTGAKSGLFEGTITKLDNTINELTKKVDSLTKRSNNIGLGAKAKSKALDDLAKATDDLAQLTTLKVGMKKATSLASKAKVVTKLKNIFPSVFSGDTARTIEKVSTYIDDAVESITKNVDEAEVKALVDEALVANNGISLAIKVTKDGIVAGVKNKAGKFKAFAKQNPIKTVVGASLIASSSAMADDGGAGNQSSGGGSFISSIPELAIGAVLLYMIGGAGLKAISKSGNIGRAISSSFKGIVDTVTNAELAKTPAGEYVGKAYALHNASLIAMGVPFKTLVYRGVDATKQLAKDLFYDPDNTANIAAEVMKKNVLEKHATAFYASYNASFGAFAARTKKSANTLLGKIDADGEVKRTFNTMVSHALENPDAIVAPEVKAVAETTRRILDDIQKRAVQYGVKGFTEKNIVENYIPQVTKYDSIARLIKAGDGVIASGGKTYNKFREQFMKMYEAKHAGTKGYKAPDLGRIGDEIMADIVNANASNIRGNIADILGDTVSNAKHRREFDKTVFLDFMINIDGEDTLIRLDHLFERDVETLVNGYTNAMEGHIALARKGYSSYTEALAVLGNDTADMQRIGGIAVNNLIGRANYDTSSTLANMVRGFSNLAPAVLMSTSAIMQIKEAGSTAIRSMKNWNSFKTASTEFANAVRGRGSDDAYMQFLMDWVGQGQTMMANKLHSRLFDDMAHITEGEAQGLSASFAAKSARAKDFAMIAYGVAPLTDWGQRMNALLNADLLVKVAHGTKKLSKTEMEAYGITDDIMRKAKQNLTLNEQGHLSASSLQALTNDKALYEELGNVVFNMGQSQMMTPMLGTTPVFFHESSLGLALGNLMSFAFNSYSTYGTSLVKGMSRGEPTQYLDLAMWLGTMYAAQELKDVVKGKERTEQEKLMAALQNIPLAAPTAFIGMATDPVVTVAPKMLHDETVKQMSSITDIMGGGTDD